MSWMSMRANRERIRTAELGNGDKRGRDSWTTDDPKHSRAAVCAFPPLRQRPLGRPARSWARLPTTMSAPSVTAKPTT